jgi:hypothetical protein
MSVRILKEKGNFRISLYESLGEMDRYLSLIHPWKRFFLPTNLAKGGSVSTGVEITIEGKQFFEKGRAYLKKLIERDSPLGYKTDDERANKLKKWKEKLPKCFLKLFYYISLYVRWNRTINLFLALSEGKWKMLPTLQTPQYSDNCFCARLEAVKAHVLGKDLYKKVKTASFELRKKDLIATAIAKKLLSPEEAKQLKRLPVTYLTYKERQKAADLLGTSTSLDFSYEKWKAIVEMLNHQIAMAKLKRIDRSQLGKVKPFRLLIGGLPRESLKTAVVINRYGFGNVKTRKIGVFHQGEWVQLHKSQFLKELMKAPELLMTEEVSLLLHFFSLNYSKLSKDHKELLTAIRKIQIGMMKEVHARLVARARHLINPVLQENLPPKRKENLELALTRLEKMEKKLSLQIQKEKLFKVPRTYFQHQVEIEKIMLSAVSPLKKGSRSPPSKGKSS